MKIKKLYIAPPREADGISEPGSFKNPYTLEILCEKKNWENTEFILLNGTYEFSGKILVFSKNGPLIIRAETRWASIINAKDSEGLIIDCEGEGIQLHDLVIQDASIEDRTVSAESQDTDISGAVYFRRPNQRLQNCIINNLKLGVGFWSSAANFVGEGNIIFNIGFYDELTPRKEGTRGHIAYGQTDGEHASIWRGNIMWGGLNHGLHCYSESNGKLDGLEIINNIIFATTHRASLVGGKKPFKDLRYEGNVVYDSDVSIGYLAHVENEKIYIINNMFLDCAPTFVNLKDVNFEYNTFVPKYDKIAYYTLMPDEELRRTYKNWYVENNQMYSKYARPGIGRQVLNGGTEIDGRGLQPFDSMINKVNRIEDFSLYKYIQAGPGLVYYMYYHSRPRQTTVLKFHEALGKVNLCNVLNPLVVISEENLNEKNMSLLLNNNDITPEPAKFFGGEIHELLPDPQRFGVLIFETIQEPEPIEPDKPDEEEGPAREDVQQLAMLIYAMTKSLDVSVDDLIADIENLNTTMKDIREILKKAQKIINNKYGTGEH